MSIQQFLDELYHLYETTKTMISHELSHHAMDELLSGKDRDHIYLSKYMNHIVKYEQSSQKVDKDRQVCLEMKEMIDFIEGNTKEKQYFLKLYHLSTIFQVIPFNDKAVYDVIKYFVAKNVELGISDSEEIFFLDKDGETKCKTVQEHYMDLLPNDIMHAAKTKKEDQEKFLQNKDDFLPGALNHNLYTIFSKKEEEVTEEDIDRVAECLNHLFFKETVTQQCIRYMKKRMEKCSKRKEAQIPLQKQTYKVKNTISYIRLLAKLTI